MELFPDGEIRQRAMNELAGIREYSLVDGAQLSFSRLIGKRNYQNISCPFNSRSRASIR